MNETLVTPPPHTSFSVNKSDFLRVTTSQEAADLADRIFGSYVKQNTLASAGSNFYYKNGIGFGIYTNTYLILQFPKFPTRIFMGVTIDAYNHGSLDLLAYNLQSSIITIPIAISYNSNNSDWSYVGGNKSGIYINGTYRTFYCGHQKVYNLINKTGNFDIEWNVADFSDCYDDSTPCTLSFRHSGGKGSKSLYMNYLEVEIE